MELQEAEKAFIYRNLNTLVDGISAQGLSNQTVAVVSLFCDPRTGEIKIGSSPYLIEISLTIDLAQHHFEWSASALKKISLKGRLNLSYTLQLLRKLSPHLKSLKDIDYFKGDSDAQKETTSSLTVDDLFSISRQEAEKLLLKKRPGSFLFRKDPYAVTLQEILRRGLKRSMTCYTLSYLDREKIVRDKTILFISQHWMIYSDDPTLQGPFWDSLKELLDSLDLSVDHQIKPNS